LLLAGLLLTPWLSHAAEPASTPIDQKAATAAPPAAPEARTLTWTVDKGLQGVTRDGTFKLKVSGWVHAWWTGKVQDGATSAWEQKAHADDAGAVATVFEKKAAAYDNELTTNEFAVRRARVVLDATLTKTMAAFVQFEFAGTSPLLDAFFTWQPLPEIGVRAGQFKTPMSRLFFLTAPWRRSFVSDPAAMTEFSLGRDLGLMLQGNVANRKLEYHLGVFNGSGSNAKQDNTDLQLVGRVATHPLGPVPDSEGDFDGASPPVFSVGVSGAWNPLEKSYYLKRDDGNGFSKTPIHTPQMTIGTDVVFFWRGLFLTGEFFYRSQWPDEAFRAKLKTPDPNQDGRVDGLGWFAAATYFVVPKRLEVLGRVSMVRPAREKDATDDLWEVTGGATWFLVGNTVALQAEYEYIADKTPYAPKLTTHQARLQLLFKF